MATQYFKRNLLNFYREGKKISLVCFLLLLKRDKNVWHLQPISAIWRPLAFLPVTLLLVIICISSWENIYQNFHFRVFPKSFSTESNEIFWTPKTQSNISVSGMIRVLSEVSEGMFLSQWPELFKCQSLSIALCAVVLLQSGTLCKYMHNKIEKRLYTSWQI